MYLLEAVIVLELRKARSGRTDAGLTAWARQHGATRHVPFRTQPARARVRRRAA
jgi:hypothetical protein